MDINDFANIPGMPKPLKITVRYDEALEKITKYKEHPTYISEGANFGYLLQTVFMSYPEIEKKYKPGVLGFSINGTPPKLHTPLFEGDIVSFHVNI